MKTQLAAVSIIARFAADATPFLSAQRYVDELKADPTWSSQELSELRLQVIRGLLDRQQHRGGEPPERPTTE